MTPRIRAFALLTAFPAVATLSACGLGRAEKTVKADASPKAIPVKVAPVSRQAVERSVEVVGTLKGWEEVNLGAKKGGRVIKVLHDMGDHVKPGEPLVELETIDARLAYAQARSKYLAELVRLGITERQAEDALKRFGMSENLLSGPETSELLEKSAPIMQASVAVKKSLNNLNRLKRLHDRGAGTSEELQNMENDYDAAKAAKDYAVSTARNVVANAYASKVAIESAEQALKDTSIKAPLPSKLPEGVDRASLTYGITKRSVAEGQILKDGDAVLELVIESPLRLWANVPERHGAEVKIGQSVRVSVSSFPGKTFAGKVARINPQVDPVSRTFQVEAVIPNEARMLRPGGFAKASILVDTNSQAYIVPIEAVLKFAGVTKVFVVQDEKAHAINVETGLEGAGWVEISTPLPPGAKVVTDGWTQLAEGTPVVVKAVGAATEDAPAASKKPEPDTAAPPAG